MIKSAENPWLSMSAGTKRRVNFDTKYDYFWYVNYSNKYGFYLNLEIDTTNLDIDIKLKGIDIIFRNPQHRKTELFFTLDSNEDWEIFFILCKDLITTIDRYKSDNDKIIELNKRLISWKNLLANKGEINISTEAQMGLFAELCCLKDIISKHKGYEIAIDSWVGSQKDCQDFCLKTCVLEVKAHRVTKGNVAYISSIDQLYTEKEKMFILSYGLSIASNGVSIDDIYNSIKQEISGEYLDKLRLKLFEVGWIPNYHGKKVEHFIIDSHTLYEVKDTFPKLRKEFIDNRIKDVKYKIDLTECMDFIVQENQLFGGDSNDYSR